MSINLKKYALFLGASLLLACPFFVSAQESLPEGGSGFTDAVLLEEGVEYEYNAEESDWFSGYDGEGYYKFEDVKAGQLLKAGVTTDNDHSAEMELYNDNRQSIVWAQESGKVGVYWFSGEKQERDYYLKLSSHSSGNNNFTLEYELEDYFDAGSNIDAGDEITNPIILEDMAEYQGYLAGAEGLDQADCYEVEVESGKGLGVKITPSLNYQPKFSAFNSDRAEIGWGEASNSGAILEEVIDPEGSDVVYLKVGRGHVSEGMVAEYTLSIWEQELEDGETEPSAPTEPTVPSPGDVTTQDVGGIFSKIFGGDEKRTGTPVDFGLGIFSVFGGLIRLFFRLVKIFIALIVVGIIIFFIVRSQKKKEEKEPTETPKEEFKGE